MLRPVCLLLLLLLTETEAAASTARCTTISYCETCTDIEETCVTCNNRYYLSADKLQCLPLPTGCLQTDVDGKCAVCLANYVWVEETDSCIECPTSCLACSYNQDAGKAECNQCAFGYLLKVTNDCLYCGSMCERCQISAIGLVQCLQCGDGYIVNENSICVSCGIACERCKYDLEKKSPECLTCRTGFALKSDLRCISCGVKHPSCLSCVEDSGQLKCTSCAEGYYQKSSTCAECPRSCADCHPSGADVVCDKCRAYYEINGVTTCDICPENCEECDVFGPLLMCKEGRCAPRYARHTSTGLCRPCPPNCESCSIPLEESVCTVCDPGYAVTAEGACERCSTHCTACYYDDSEFRIRCYASKCERGYGYNDADGTCITCGLGCAYCTVEEDGETTCSVCEPGTGHYGRGCKGCPGDCLLCDRVGLSEVMICRGSQCRAHADAFAFDYENRDCSNACTPAVDAYCSGDDPRHDRYGACFCGECQPDANGYRSLRLEKGAQAGYCQGCSHVAGCMECQLRADQTDIECTRCELGLTLLNTKKCADCTAHSPFCEVFSDDGSGNCLCTQCHPGAGLVLSDPNPANNYKCTACPLYSGSPTTCVECSDPQDQVTPGLRCTACGFADILVESDTDSQCIPVIENCARMIVEYGASAIDTECGMCAQRYGYSSTAKTCTQCNPYGECLMCTYEPGPPGVCLYCEGGKGHGDCSDPCLGSPNSMPSTCAYSGANRPGTMPDPCYCVECLLDNEAVHVTSTLTWENNYRQDTTLYGISACLDNTQPGVVLFANCDAYVRVKRNGNLITVCNKCAAGYLPTVDGTACISCSTTTILHCVESHLYVDTNNACRCSKCSDISSLVYLSIERDECANCPIEHCLYDFDKRSKWKGECRCWECEPGYVATMDYRQCVPTCDNLGCTGAEYALNSVCHCTYGTGCSPGYVYDMDRLDCTDCSAMPGVDGCVALYTLKPGSCLCQTCDAGWGKIPADAGCVDCTPDAACISFELTDDLSCQCLLCTDHHAVVDLACVDCTSQLIDNCRATGYRATDAGVCTCADCTSGFVPSVDGFSCQRCDQTLISNCKSDGYLVDAGNTCLCVECADGYQLKSDGTECYPCNSLSGLSGCDRCKVDERDQVVVGTQCLRCQERYYLSDGLCYACPPQCEKCRLGGVSGTTTLCLQFFCDATYGLSDKTYQCNGCGINNCEVCFVDDRDRSWCKRCYPGHVVRDGGASCMVCSSHCDVCDEEGKCLPSGCKEGFVANLDLDNTCEVCETGCSLCRYNGQLQECHRCYDGYTRTLDRIHCAKCIAHCRVCADEQTCSSCYDGYFYDAPSKTCYPCSPPCASCHYEVSVSGVQCSTCADHHALVNGVCLPCPVGCNGCTAGLDGITLECTSCFDAYVRALTVCIPCPAHCRACSRNDQTALVTCLPDQCDVGFGRKSDQLCHACPLANCRVCVPDPVTDVLSCTSCVGSYYLNQDICSACPRWCPTCSWDDDRMRCSTCDARYVLTLAGECLACPRYCDECELGAGGEASCTRCTGDGAYSLTLDGQCLSCAEAAFLNCANCTDADPAGQVSCLRCADKFTLKDDKSTCLQCTIGQCGVCTHGALCTQCDAGTAAFDDDHQCGYECLECDGDAAACGGDLSHLKNSSLITAAGLTSSMCSGVCQVWRTEEAVSGQVRFTRGCVNTTCVDVKEVCEENKQTQVTTCTKCCVNDLCNDYDLDGVPDGACAVCGPRVWSLVAVAVLLLMLMPRA